MRKANWPYWLLFLVCSVAQAEYPYNSVARIGDEKGGGSGTLIAKSDDHSLGLVITNAHVCNKKAEYPVYWPMKDKPKVGKTVNVNHTYDLALLVVKNPGIDTIPVGFAVKGETNISCGFPYYDRKQLHYQVGEIVGAGVTILVTNNRTPPGFSGGAVFNSAGQLCGVNRAVSKTHSYAVSDLVLMVYLKDFKDPATWVADDSHTKNPHEYHGAPCNDTYKSEPYDPDKAPKL